MSKRILDLALVIPLLLLTAPLWLCIAVWIKLDARGPVLFRQTRVGKGGRLFSILKFRTMVVDAEKSGYYTAHDDPRITRPGALLRRTSLDELPQLLNILRGEMSVVGPRPTLPYQVAQYTPRQRRRLAVKPGVTGWAQVNGRNTLSWPQRIELDVWYVEHQSLWLNLRILARTLRVWLRGEGVYADKDKFKISAQDDAHLGGPA
jgi:lipopolysaccharide/colanic/teichoic acid biosynthesis glycosyltransferase